MLNISDIEAIENFADDQQQHYEALQRAINSLTAWQLQGHYGRTMMDALTDGFCLLGTQHTRDYWGNRIPARTEVKPGTLGSFEYVARINGVEYAKRMESL
jgi:hypothetical protein